MIVNLAFGLFVVMYATFSAYTIYMVLIGKKTPEANPLGKFIFWHGQGWIIAMVATAIMTLSFIFANIVLRYLYIIERIGH